MTETNKKTKFTEKELKNFAYNFEIGELMWIPKEGLVVLGDYFAQQVEDCVQTDDKTLNGRELSALTHGLCHIYEEGYMANKLARPVGDILLDKLIEKAEQGYPSHANRSIDGYWQSVKDNPDAWKGLKAVLEKHPNYAFGQKYLGYMNGATPEDAKVLTKHYLENKDMLFVTTTMVDIDGTLIQNGKANDLLIADLIGLEDALGGIAIYTGGNPETQKKVLSKAIAETFFNKFPLNKNNWSVDIILDSCSNNDEEHTALRKRLLNAVKNNVLRHFAIQFNIQTEQEWEKMLGNNYDNQRKLNTVFICAEYMLEFLNRLLTKSDNQIKIYPKHIFTQNNICLGGAVVDDTQPDAQEIKSLTSAVLNPRESSFWKTDAVYTGGKYLDVPETRKVTAKQVFDMYQKKLNKQMINTISR